MDRRSSFDTDSVRHAELAAPPGPGPRGVPGEAAGAINMARLEAPNLSQISFERVLAWNPDWILASDPAFFAGICPRAVWSGLPAVRARRVLLAASR